MISNSGTVGRATGVGTVQKSGCRAPPFPSHNVRSTGAAGAKARKRGFGPDHQRYLRAALSAARLPVAAARKKLPHLAVMPHRRSPNKTGAGATSELATSHIPVRRQGCLRRWGGRIVRPSRPSIWGKCRSRVAVMVTHLAGIRTRRENSHVSCRVHQLAAFLVWAIVAILGVAVPAATKEPISLRFASYPDERNSTIEALSAFDSMLADLSNDEASVSFEQSQTGIVELLMKSQIDMAVIPYNTLYDGMLFGLPFLFDDLGASPSVACCDHRHAIMDELTTAGFPEASSAGSLHHCLVSLRRIATIIPSFA